MHITKTIISINYNNHLQMTYTIGVVTPPHRNYYCQLIKNQFPKEKSVKEKILANPN